MFERATRLCAMSPPIATRSPSNDNPRSRIVYRSKRACVGCSCHPSPALMTEDFTPRARVSAAPADGCRKTIISACIASIWRAVSSKVSPLTTLLDDGEKLITSALSRLAANSNEVRVLVLGSKNRLTTVRPRSAGTFLMSRPVTSLNESAVSKINRISSTDRGARLKRSLRLRLIVPSISSGLGDHHPIIFAFFFQQHLDLFFAGRRNIFPDIRRLNRQLTMTSINQDGKLNFCRPSQIDQSIHRRANSPARKQHVVDQHNDPVGNIEWNRGFAENWLLLPQREVVPIEGNVQFADRHRCRFNLLYPPHQSMSQMHPSGANPDQRQCLDALIPLENFMGDAGERPGNVSRVHYQPFALSVYTRHHRLILTTSSRFTLSRVLKKTVQQGRSERRAEAYPLGRTV